MNTLTNAIALIAFYFGKSHNRLGTYRENIVEFGDRPTCFVMLTAWCLMTCLSEPVRSF